MPGPVPVADDFGGVPAGASPSAQPAGPAEVQDDFGGVPAAPAPPTGPTPDGLRATYEAVRGTSPDEQAQIRKVGRETGVPENVVSLNPTAVAGAQVAPQFDMLPSHSPFVAQHLQDPRNMAAAHDDLDSLTGLEWALTGGWVTGARGDLRYQAPSFWEALKKGASQLRIDFEKTREKLGLDPSWTQILYPFSTSDITEQARRARQAPDIANAQREIQAKSLAARAWVGTFEALPMLTGNISAGALTGPAGMLVFNSGMVYGRNKELVDSVTGPDGKPLSPEARLAVAGTTTAAEAALYTFGLGTFGRGMVGPIIRKVPGEVIEKTLASNTVPRIIGRFIARYGIAEAEGAATMAGAQAIERLGMQAAHKVAGDDFDVSAVTGPMLDDFQSGLLDFALLSAVGPGRRLLHDVGISRMSAREASSLQEAADRVKESKLQGRDPGAVEGLVDQMAPGQSVLIDRAAWDRYWQGKRIDPAKKAADIAQDGGSAYEASGAATGYLALPLNRYLSTLATTEHVLGLSPDVKMSAETRTPREEAAFQEAASRMDAEAKRARGAQFEEDKRAVAKLIRDQAESVELDPEVRGSVPAVAELIAESAGAVSLRTGIPVREATILMGLSRFRILGSKGEAVASATHEQLRASLSPAARAELDAARSGDRRAQVRLEAKAYIDPLTTLPNAAAFDSFKEHAATEPSWHVAIDVHDLGSQDIHGGHEAGNAALVRIAEHMRAANEATGGEARLFRWGGDEFHAGGFKAKKSAEAFAEAFKGRTAAGEEVAPGWKPSASLGIGPDVASADKASYQAKAAKKAKLGAYSKEKRVTGPWASSGESFSATAGEAERGPAGEVPLATVGEKVVHLVPSIPLPERNAGRVVTPQRPGTGDAIRYRVIEAEQLVPSHTSDTFAPSPGYPEGVQERDYRRQPEEQLKVQKGGQQLDPSFLLSDTPSALDGPPIVTSGDKALVLGGNGRSMMLLRGLRDEATAKRYRDALAERAGALGIDPAELQGKKSPVLVRELSDLQAGAPKADLVAAVRRFNEGMTQALAPRLRAVAEAKTLTPETVHAIGEILSRSEGSLRDIMRDEPMAVAEVLRRDGIINPQNQAEWLRGRAFTDEGKERLEGMFVGRVIATADRMAATPTALLAKVERIATSLLRVEGVNPGLAETVTVQKALDLVNEARIRKLEVAEVVGQLGLFSADRPDAGAVGLAKLFESAKPTELQDRFKTWADRAAFDPRQESLFGGQLTQGEARALLLGKEASVEQPARGRPPLEPVGAEGLPAWHTYQREEAGKTTAAIETPKGRILISYGEMEGGVWVEANRADTGLKVGTAEFAKTRDGNLKGWQVDVSEDHQRLGIASAMYEWARKMSGKSIGRGDVLTQVGQAFRDARETTSTLEQRGRPVSTETPSFRRWFGKSKVVDAEGQPLVVYHGTSQAGFEAFDPKKAVESALYGPGFYATENPKVASGYTEKEGQTSPGVYPLHLAIEKPFRADAPASDLVPALTRFKAREWPAAEIRRLIDEAMREDSSIASPDGVGAWIDNTEWAWKIAEQMGKGGEELVRPHFDYILEKTAKRLAGEIRAGEFKTGEDVLRYIENNVFEILQPGGGNIRDVLQRLGFDGITHIGGDRLGGGETPHRVWIAFKPEQVKSIFNRGAFDPTKKSILEQTGDTGPRGLVRMRLDATGRPVDFPVQLLAGDASTLAHETGHFFSWAMHDVAMSENGRSLRPDYDALLKWAGYDSPEERLQANLERGDLEAQGTLSAADRNRFKELRAKEERIGHGFEQYLAEGKAPTAALARPFAWLRAGLMRVYRGLFPISEQYRQHYGQDLQLSDEVRGIFDRWLAAESEVGKYESNLDAEASAELLAKLEPADREAVIRARANRRAEAESRVYTALNQAEHAEHADIREKLRAEIAAEMAETPVGKVSEYLKRDKAPESGLVDVALGNLNADLLDESGRPWKLDRAELVEDYGPGILKQLPRGATLAKGGVPADFIAERFGFQTGEEMIQALRGAGDRDAVLDARVQERMKELYPTMAEDPQAAVQAAVDAEHTPQSAEEALVGARILARRVDPSLAMRLRVMEDREARKATAERIISEMPVGDLSPARFLQNERRAAREAIDLTGKAMAKDSERRREYAARAMDARDVQLLNMELWRAARDAKIEAEGTRDYFSEMGQDKKRRQLGKATSTEEGPDGSRVVTQPYLDRMDDLRARLDFRQSGTQVGRAARFQKWLDAQPPDAQDDILSRVSPQLIASLDRPQHWRSLTVQELRDLRAAAEVIEAQAKLKMKLRYGFEDIDREEGILRAVDEIKARYPGGALTLVPRAESGQALRGAGRRALYLGERPEETYRKLGETMTKLTWEPMSRAEVKWRQLVREVSMPIMNAIEALPREEKAALRERFTVEGQTIDGEAAFAILLNWGNESNRSKTLQGFDILRQKGFKKIPSFTPDGVKVVLNDRFSRAQAEVAQRMWDQMSSKWELMADLEKKHTGLAPPKVEPLPFSLRLKDGTTFEFKGGYYPMSYDPRFSTAGQRMGERIAQGGVNAMAFQGERAVTPQGHLQTRIESFARPIDLSLPSVPRHITETMKDLAMREALLSARDVLTDGRIRDAVSDAIGPEGYQHLVRHWRDVANDAAMMRGDMRMLMRIRSASAGSTIAWNIPVAMQHLTNFFPSLTMTAGEPGSGEATMRIPPRFAAAAVAKFGAERWGLRDRICGTKEEDGSIDGGLSSYMYERIHDQESMGIQNAVADLTLRRGLVTTTSEKIREVGMFAIHGITAASATAGWWGAYLHATAPKEQGGLGLSGERDGPAAQHADAIVRITQTSYRSIDRSLVERSPLWKPIVMFYGYLNSQFNVFVGTNADARRLWNEGARHQAIKLVAFNYGILMASGIMAALLVGKGPKDEGKDGDIDAGDWARWATEEALMFPVTTAPVARPLVEALMGDKSRDVSLTPWLKIANSVASVSRDIRKAGSEEASGAELPRAGLEALEAAGLWYGLPVVQLRRTGHYWLDLTPDGFQQSPESEQASKAEAAMGTFYGRKHSGKLSEAVFGQ